LNRSVSTNENNANAMMSIKNSERCLILFKTAMLRVIYSNIVGENTILLE